MKEINEGFQKMENLLEEVQSLITPISVHKDFKWLMDRENGSKFGEKYPKCVLPINIGRTPVFLPICNRMGVEDPAMVKIAHSIVCKLSGHHNRKKLEGELQIVKLKLEKIMRKYGCGEEAPENNIPSENGTDIAVDRIEEYADILKKGV
jgi:hypothetical protein